MSTSTDDATLGGSLRPRGPVQLALSTRQHPTHDHASDEHPHATVVAVGGELDVFTTPRLMTYLDSVVRRGQGDLVLDLTETLFIDSLGMHALLSVQRRLSRHSRALVVVCSDGPVRRAIELARLTEAFGVVSTLTE